MELSLEQTVKILTNLGLTRLDAEIYVYSGNNGPLIIEDLEMVLNYSKDQIYTSLKTLIAERLMTQKGTIFYAIPFEKAFELLTKMDKKQAKFWLKAKRVFKQ